MIIKPDSMIVDFLAIPLLVIRFSFSAVSRIRVREDNFSL